MIRVGSLFSGIGGLELGLEQAGMRTVWQVENSAHARQILARHWPGVPRFDDVRNFDPRAAGAVDLVCGGFPCQPHSLAGLRKAGSDERDLWDEFARVVRLAQPRWVVAENVPGLFSSALAGLPGAFFGRVVTDLAEMGYCVRWDVLGAWQAGAWHRRDRVFLVAHACGSGCQGGHAAQEGRGEPGLGDRLVAHANGAGRQGRPAACGEGGIADVGAGRSIPNPYRAGCEAREPATEAGAPGLPAPGGRSGCADALSNASCERCQRARAKLDAVGGAGPGGSGLHVSDTHCLGCQPAWGEAGPGFPGWASPQALGDAHHHGQPQPCRILADFWGWLGDPGGWPAQPGLGGGADGLPAGVDGAASDAQGEDQEGSKSPEGPNYPSLRHKALVGPAAALHWASGAWEEGLPRTIPKIPWRTLRLYRLGNAVVPAQVYPVGLAIAHATRRTPC